jgi:hypothetical protein
MEKGHENLSSSLKKDDVKKWELLHNLRSVHLQAAKEDNEKLLSWKQSLSVIKLELDRRMEAHRRLALLTFHPSAGNGKF